MANLTPGITEDAEGDVALAHGIDVLGRVTAHGNPVAELNTLNEATSFGISASSAPSPSQPLGGHGETWAAQYDPEIRNGGEWILQKVNSGPGGVLGNIHLWLTRDPGLSDDGVNRIVLAIAAIPDLAGVPDMANDASYNVASQTRSFLDLSAGVLTEVTLDTSNLGDASFRTFAPNTDLWIGLSLSGFITTFSPAFSIDATDTLVPTVDFLDNGGAASPATPHNQFRYQIDYETAILAADMATGAVRAGVGVNAVGRGAFAAGEDSTASADAATAMGSGTVASRLAAFAAGLFTRAVGQGASALGYGARALAEAAHAQNLITLATGIAATAMGENTQSSGRGALATGFATTAPGDYASAFGHDTTAAGRRSLAQGAHTTASEDSSFSTGIGSVAEQGADLAHASGWITNRGDTQYSQKSLRIQTSDATPARLLIGGSSDGTGIPTPVDVAIPTGETWQVLAQVTGSRKDTPGTVAMFLLKGAVSNTSGTARLVGSVTNETWADAAASAWLAVLDVNAGNLTLTVTGEAANTITWHAVLHLNRVAV